VHHFPVQRHEARIVPEIAAHLDAYLDHLRETYPERYPRSARDYLEDWAAPNRAYLRKYYPKSGPDAEFDLTPATEKAIEWLQTLAPQQFIGTESRLLTLFQLLCDLAAPAQEDPSARIRDLTRKRDDIERRYPSQGTLCAGRRHRAPLARRLSAGRRELPRA
jgi:uncharacterized protein DUF3375